MVLCLWRPRLRPGAPFFARSLFTKLRGESPRPRLIEPKGREAQGWSLASLPPGPEVPSRWAHEATEPLSGFANRDSVEGSCA